MAFEIRVPTGKKGSQAATGSKAPMSETNKLLKKLDKTMIANIDLVEILSGFMQ